MFENYDAIANKIRAYPDQVLDMYTKGTNPEVPPWLAMTILKERNNFEKGADMARAAGQPPQPTVRDKLVQQTGIMANMGQAQPMAAQGAPQAPTAPKGFAQGGIIGFSGKTGSEVPMGDDPFKSLLYKALTEQPEYNDPGTMEEYLAKQKAGLEAQGITSLPFAAQRDRIAEIEGRRAKEDAARAEQLKQRPLDELVSFLVNAKGGRASQALGSGAAASQAAQAENRAQDLNYQKMRDEQSMRALELKSMNDKAELELARGNIEGYNRLQAEIAKRKQDFQQHQIQGAASGFQTMEQARSRREAAAARSAGTDPNVQNAIRAIKEDEAINRWQKDIDAANKIPTAANRARAATLEKQILDRQNEIYKHFKVELPPATMNGTPSSPTGGKVVDWNSIGK